MFVLLDQKAEEMKNVPSIRPLQNVFWNLLGFLELLGSENVLVV